MKEWFKARNIWGAAILALSDADAGKLAKAIWEYTMNGNIVDLDGDVKGSFAMILMTLAQDDEKSEELSSVRAKAGSKGGNQKQANITKSKQEVANDSKTYQTVANEAIATNKNKNKSKNKEKEEEQELLFERFWSAYPRHVNKQSAREAFAKIDPSEEVMEIILREIERQKRTPQWTKDNGQYIPHPATWLNGARWEDEVTEAKPAVNAQAYSQRDYSGEQDEAMKRMLQMEGA